MKQFLTSHPCTTSTHNSHKVISHKFHARRSPYWRRQQQTTYWLNYVWQMSAQSQSKVTEWMNGWGKCVKKNLDSYMEQNDICASLELRIHSFVAWQIFRAYSRVLGQSYIIMHSLFGFICERVEEYEHNLFILDAFYEVEFNSEAFHSNPNNVMLKKSHKEGEDYCKVCKSFFLVMHTYMHY